MEYRSRSLRLDDEVWEALQKLPISTNQFLRKLLTADGVFDSPVLGDLKPHKLSKKAAKVEALRASDPMASERPEIDYGAHEEVPSGGSVSVVGAAVPVKAVGARPHNVHSGVRPVPGCAQCKAMA